ncbi:MAG: ABC transporter substrate-binding protein [Calditrichaceae bacterium]|nr:ABC transporter substrate-binding protein [Calditrichaceae bacterium]MBN2709010.1 ABC transporter substrate-binding protein [Calditrichaceae bacterium]RQV95338.1 MAG: hypothetical protein EH224_07940 [Calditrichota bacterium]
MIHLNKSYTTKTLISSLVLIVLLIIIINCGKEKPEIYHIGILSGAKTFDDIADGFISKMSELGYIEGKNVSYDHQKSDFDLNRYKSIIKKFISDKADLIFVFPTEPAVVAKESTLGTKIPVVFAMTGIERNNLVESVSRPGGNITGVRFPGPELTVRRLDILIELVPEAKRVYIIYDKNYPNTLMALEGLRPAAASSGIKLIEDSVSTIEELQLKLAERSKARNIGMDAILLMPDILNNSIAGFELIKKFADKCKIPIGGGMDFTADMGALFSFVPNNKEQGELAAVLANKIFDGVPAGTIMLITPPAKLRINYKVIQELNISVSEGLLSRADEIIR